MTNKENIDKKNIDSNLGKNLDKKNNLENSFENFKNSLQKLKNEIKESQNTWIEKEDIKKLDEEIKNIDDQIKIERDIERHNKEWNLDNYQEEKLSKQMKIISDWLEKNPWEANKSRTDSAYTILNEIYSSDPNPIANSMLKIIRFILSL